MPNHMLLAQSVEKEVAKGMPDGMTENFLKKLPYLLNRIKELENALAPLAGVYARNRAVAESHNLEMQEVYFKDLKNAFNVMDINQSYVPKKETLFPA